MSSRSFNRFLLLGTAINIALIAGGKWVATMPAVGQLMAGQCAALPLQGTPQRGSMAVTVAYADSGLKTGSETPHVSKLLGAIIEQESGGNENAIGDDGNAVGILQIHKITVDDANRILGRAEFCYYDRWNKDRSIEIFNVITEHYLERCPAHNSLSENFSDNELVARRWNGGPRGETKTATLKYWQAIERKMQ